MVAMSGRGWEEAVRVELTPERHHESRIYKTGTAGEPNGYMEGSTETPPGGIWELARDHARRTDFCFSMRIGNGEVETYTPLRSAPSVKHAQCVS
jgi:hypothetical protein